MGNSQCNRSGNECSVLHEDVVGKVLTNFPDEHNFEVAASFFKMLGDPTRTKIIWCLDQNEMCVCDIAATLGMTKSAISHQLAKLKAVNLVTCKRQGKEVIYFRQNSPRDQILNCISRHDAAIIDICCGTMSNSINIALKRPDSKVTGRKLYFFPIKVLEPAPFATFYRLNKQDYFKKHGFKTIKQYHCNYTTVLELEKEDAL